MAGKVRRVALRPDFSTSRIPNQSSSTLINCYASGEKGKGAFPIVGVPGLASVLELGGPIRGQRLERGIWYVVAGTRLYTVGDDFAATDRGEIPGSGAVEIVPNRFQIGIVAAPRLFVLTISTMALVEVVDDGVNGFTGCMSMAVVSGTGVYVRPGGDAFGITGLDDFTSINALDFASAESRADPLIAARSLNGQILLFGSNTVELQTYTGDDDFPFGRAGAADVGAVSRDTIQPVGTALMWLGREVSTDLVTLYMAQNYQPQSISSPTIDRLIERATNLDSAYAVTWGLDGHLFYTLVLDSGAATYDLSTRLSHQAASGVWPMAGFPPPTAIRNQSRIGGFNIFGDDQGRLLKASYDAHSEAGAPLIREIVTPTSGDLGRASIVHELELMVESGKGGVTLDPQWLMQFSTDGGHTWSEPEAAGSGKSGEFTQRVVWRSLGRGADWIFRFRLTDDAPFHVMGVWASAETLSVP